jgi:hypothetical protein
MAEIFKYLDEFDCCEPCVLLERIKNTFQLSYIQAQDIYKKWKSDYMKPKTKVDMNKTGGWRKKRGQKFI